MLAALKEIRKGIVNPVLAQHRGRIFKLTGGWAARRVPERGQDPNAPQNASFEDLAQISTTISEPGVIHQTGVFMRLMFGAN